MAFLDNSGDIILDAVLTDTGRMRLAKGDGSFKITKFALGDDEINYALYRNSNNPLGAHPSGSAFADLDILQTPSLEAFTNNTSLLKHRLVTYSRNDLLYLPVIKPNQLTEGTGLFTLGTAGASYTIAVDDNTAGATAFGSNPGSQQGVFNGLVPDSGVSTVRLDFGIDSPDVPKGQTVDVDLQETQLIVELDNRLGGLVLVSGNGNGEEQNFDFLDDDQVATYVLTNAITPHSPDVNTSTNDSALAGPFQGKAQFKFTASTNLRTSEALFNQFGQTITVSSETFKYIDTIMRVTGGNTGFSVDIALRFLKKTA
jgi:hypothetical protein